MKPELTYLLFSVLLTFVQVLIAAAAANQVAKPCAMRIGHGVLISRTGLGQALASATSAAVAAKDIWKPGWVTASGWSSRTTKAATAKACRLIARRSARIAPKAAPGKAFSSRPPRERR